MKANFNKIDIAKKEEKNGEANIRSIVISVNQKPFLAAELWRKENQANMIKIAHETLNPFKFEPNHFRREEY